MSTVMRLTYTRMATGMRSYRTFVMYAGFGQTLPQRPPEARRGQFAPPACAINRPRYDFTSFEKVFRRKPNRPPALRISGFFIASFTVASLFSFIFTKVKLKCRSGRNSKYRCMKLTPPTRGMRRQGTQSPKGGVSRPLGRSKLGPNGLQ